MSSVSVKVYYKFGRGESSEGKKEKKDKEKEGLIALDHTCR